MWVSMTSNWIESKDGSVVVEDVILVARGGLSSNLMFPDHAENFRVSGTRGSYREGVEVGKERAMASSRGSISKLGPA